VRHRVGAQGVSPGDSGLRGRAAIVTGGGYGIGRAIALAFGRAGANVTLAARGRPQLEQVAEQLRGMGTRPLVCVTDVSSESDVEAMVRRSLDEFGIVDVLVNNAGIAGPTGLARDVAASDWNLTLAVNLTGAFLCAKHAGAAMIEKKRGAIVNISSVAGRIGYALRTPYAASKWGMIGLSHSLAAELGPHGIRVNVVLPGSTKGERLSRVIAARAAAEGKSIEAMTEWYTKDAPLGRMVTEDEVADAVLYLASDAASGITGQAISVCGGFCMR
jgi:NAD(P)-dependent dehydrogenase (short-subunit alcohol dehydrogenase family)